MPSWAPPTSLSPQPQGMGEGQYAITTTASSSLYPLHRMEVEDRGTFVCKWPLALYPSASER